MGRGNHYAGQCGVDTAMCHDAMRILSDALHIGHARAEWRKVWAVFAIPHEPFVGDRVQAFGSIGPERIAISSAYRCE
jgi:hypothetical protein